MSLPLLPAGFLLQSSYTNAYTQLMPLVILALLVDVMILVIWYYIGVVLNNRGVKGAAKNEFYQFIGTCIMVAIIIATLVFVSTAFYSVMGATKLMSPTAVSALCTNIMTTSSFDIIGKTNSLLSGPVTSTGTGSFPGICALVSGSKTDITSGLDYPLSATAVVIANLTNQTAANLNYSFTFDVWINFLSTLSPELNLCIDKPPTALPCVIPNPFQAPLFDLVYKNTPYAGYSLITSNLNTFGSLLNFSVQSFVAQLILITIFLYTWPYMLFAGIILRSTFITRRIGGLLMAAAIAGLIIIPLVFSFEYLAIGNGFQTSIGTSGANPNGYNSTYNFNVITTLPSGTNSNVISTLPSGTSGNYIVNFFVEPNIKSIANTLNCWPSGISPSTTTSALGAVFPALGAIGTAASLVTTSVGPGLFKSEAIDVASLLLPAASIWNLLKFAIIQSPYSNPSILLPVNCKPQAALSTFFAVLNAYGIIGIDSYLLPFINLVIFITAVIGLSSLFGGDTELAGLSKLI